MYHREDNIIEIINKDLSHNFLVPLALSSFLQTLEGAAESFDAQCLSEGMW